MKTLILGGDGYLGWPTCMYFANLGHQVYTVDNFCKRQIELEVGVTPLNKVFTLQERIDFWNKNSNNKIELFTGDILNHKFLYEILENIKPENIIHYAEQTYAP